MTAHDAPHGDTWIACEEVEPSALEYARSIDFCRDYTLDDPFDACLTSLLLLNTEHDWDDPPGAPPLVDASFHEQFKERFKAPKEAAVILQKVMCPDESYSPLNAMPDIVPRKSLKIELPLLLTDHDVDMRVFCTRTPEVALHELKLPLEHVDVENDEDMEWPARYKNLPAEVIKRISEERLVIPNDAIKFLQSVIVLKDENVYHNQMYAEIEGYVKPKSNLITPPLTPMLSPVVAPFDPSSDTGHLPLLSDDADSIAVEVDAIDKRLQDRDRIQAPNFNLSDELDLMNMKHMAQMYTPMQPDLASSIPLPSPKRRVSELTVEVPLITSDSSSSGSSKKRKTVSFAEQLSTLIPPTPLITMMIPPRLMHELDPASEESVEAFFHDVVEPKALEVEQAAQQEQLQAEDSLQRVAVPVMDFKHPPPPWATGNRTTSAQAKKHNLADAWQELLVGLKTDRQDMSEYGPWKMTATMERELQPYPFSAELGKVPPEPPINDPRSIAVIMSDMSLEDVVTSDDLVWKTEGLRIQERHKYELEDDMEPMQYDEEELDPNNMDDLLYRRHKEILQARPEPSRASILPQKRALEERAKALSTREAADSSGHKTGSILASGFTTASNLHSFMNSVGQQSKIVPQSRELAEEVRQPAPTGRVLEHMTCHPIEDVHVLQAMEEDTVATVPFKLPSLPVDRPDRAVVISIDLLRNHRNILRIVFKELYRNAKHIERDLSSIPGAPEADMLLSPGTGLIMTSLQKLKQKPLPGQVQVNGVRERITKLASRYEMLIVLINNGLACDDIEVDERDCEAVIEFQAFCAQCRAEVQIDLVSGGDESMAAWIAMSTYEFGDTGQEMSLLHEETMWEQVLRRMGLNAYAAQSVLASLKDADASSSSDTITDINSGIGAFMRMSPEQRIASFAGLLGGQRVLRNVNKVLEQPWISAQTGLR